MTNKINTTMWREHCPKCRAVTLHIDIPDDEYFEYAAQCTDCGVVWEMNPPDESNGICNKVTHNEKLQALADAGIDTWEDYRGDK